eukprot:Skav226470  [mRNA]  locus=scaffold4441:825:4086:- [translate_table: standard]
MFLRFWGLTCPVSINFTGCRGLEVKLKLVWSNLIAPLIPRLRTGEVDIDLSPNPHLSEEAKKEHLNEVTRRQALQNSFFKQWLLDTRGPRQNYYWKFDNRESYRTELANLLSMELAEYRMQFDKLYEILTDEDFGPELVEKDVEEVLDKSMLSQLRAHRFPVWVEQLDLREAMEELRLVGAAGFAGQKEKFNAENPSLSATYRHGPVKTEERTKRKERSLGFSPSAESFDSRTTASHVLDILRGTICATRPG